MSGPASEDGSGKGPAIAHNTYSSLVQADDDLVGHVAYALYKRDKLKFCDDVARNQGRAPSADELSIFIRSSNLETRLQGYRTSAEALLGTFTELQLEEVVGKIEADADQRLLRELRASKSWVRVIQEGLVVSIVVALVWTVLVAALYAARIGPQKMLSEVFGVRTETLSPESSDPTR